MARQFKNYTLKEKDAYFYRKREEAEKKGNKTEYEYYNNKLLFNRSKMLNDYLDNNTIGVKRKGPKYPNDYK